MLLALVIVVTLVITVGCVVWVVYSKLREERYTRDKYAFRCLAAYISLIGLAVAAVSSKQGLVDHVLEFASSVAGQPYSPDPPAPMSEKLLIVALVTFGIYVIYKSHQNWHGLISVDEASRRRLQRPYSILSQGLDEGKRLLRRQPARAIYRDADRLKGDVATPSEPNLVWHEHARELFELWHASCIFDNSSETAWDPRAKCWLGRHTRRDEPLLLFCYQSVPSESDLKEAADYFAEVARKCSAAAYAVYPGQTSHRTLQHPFPVTLISERYLLDHLVDFTDYYNEIRRRVERLRFPDTDRTIKDIFAPSSLAALDGVPVSEDMIAYFETWSSKPAGRQLVVLGEYGQGKSTGALMFCYEAIASQLSKSGLRVPILIELRGKSPSNLLPLELLGTWAQQYKLHAQALMKLLLAGRLILIFEGFDEMANVSNVEARLSHFRSLWQFGFANSKIVFTGRPNLFFEDRELEIVFKTAEGSGAIASCEVLRLLPFDAGKVEHSLRWTDEETRQEILAAAAANSQIMDIVARPSLLYIVAVLWRELRPLLGTSRITSAQVIDRFISHSYLRQADKERALGFAILTTSERRYFHEGLAVFMAAGGTTNQITGSDMNTAIERLYRTYPDSAHILDDVFMEGAQAPLKKRLSDPETAVETIATDVRTHGILVNDLARRGAFRFAHKSFYELLFAKSCAYDILNVNPGFYGAIRAAMDGRMGDVTRSGQIVRFFAEVIVGEIELRQRPSDGPIEVLDAITRNRDRSPLIRRLVRDLNILSARLGYAPLIAVSTSAFTLLTTVVLFGITNHWFFGSVPTVANSVFYGVLGGVVGGPIVIIIQLWFRGGIEFLGRAPVVIWAAVLIAADEAEGVCARLTQMKRLVGRSSTRTLSMLARRILAKP